MEQSKQRTISVRLTDDVVVQLETLARFDGVALAEEIREGIGLLLAARKADPEFHDRVRTVLEDAKTLLNEIGEEDVAEASANHTGPRGGGRTAAAGLGALQPGHGCERRRLKVLAAAWRVFTGDARNGISGRS